MFMMSQKDASRSTYPAASSADANYDWILGPHESGSSTQATEIDPIEEKLDSLRRNEALITQQYARLLEKNDEIELGKQPEQLSELETEIKDLREETAVEPGELELKLLLAKNFMKQKQKDQAATKLEESQVRLEVAQNTAEAEVKGLRHVGCASEKLRRQDDADTQRKLELIRRVQGHMVELEELEAGGGNSVQECLDTISPPKLSFSAVTTGACTAPIETEDDETEIEELREYLSTVELENAVLMTHFTNSTNSYRQLVADFDTAVEHVHALRETNLRLTTRNENLVSQLEAQMQLLRTKDQDTEQRVAQARAEVTAEYQARIDALEAQRQRTYSIFSDPDFVASLRDSNASIHSFSRSLTPTVPCSNPCCAGSAAAQAPNVTLNINLRPNDRGLWSLLRHVHRSVFWTSLNIEGPQRLVQEFVASIEQADREFEEQARRVARLERAVADRAEDFAMLREWLG